jgi:hypothetical protein
VEDWLHQVTRILLFVGAAADFISYESGRNQAFSGMDISKPYTKKLDFLDFVGNCPCQEAN